MLFAFTPYTLKFYTLKNWNPVKFELYLANIIFTS